ncbi:hypothetical protein K8R47_01610 [archaeon]|nr:hypothetical protein [archaeon]
MTINLHIWYESEYHQKYFINTRGERTFGNDTQAYEDFSSLLKHLETIYSKRKAFLVGVSEEIERYEVDQILKLIKKSSTKIKFGEGNLEKELKKRSKIEPQGLRRSKESNKQPFV